MVSSGAQKVVYPVPLPGTTRVISLPNPDLETQTTNASHEEEHPVINSDSRRGTSRVGESVG